VETSKAVLLKGESDRATKNKGTSDSMTRGASGSKSIALKGKLWVRRGLRVSRPVSVSMMRKLCLGLPASWEGGDC